MKNLCAKSFVVMVAACALTVGVARSAIIVVDTYDDGLTAWTLDSAVAPGGGPGSGVLDSSQQPDAYGTNPYQDSGIDNAVEFHINSTTGGGTYDDRIHVDGGNLSMNVINDPLPSYYAVSFQFYVNGSYTPDTLSVYLQTSNGTSWYYDLTSPGASAGWTLYEQRFNKVGWYDPYGGQYGATAVTQFMADLAAGNLAEVGVRVLYQDQYGSPQEYGVRDYGFGYLVPEPGTYITLSTALMSLGFTFARRRRQEKKA